MTLKELWNKGGVLIYPTDKEYTHGYLNVYDNLFSKIQNKEVNIFECGYGDGGSCKLWEDYFPNAQIRSIDIEKRDHVWSKGGKDFPVRSRVRLDYINLHKLPVTYFDDFPLDIAIDDASHLISDQIIFVKTIWPILKKGGLMIIEDIQDIDHNIQYFNKFNIPFKVVDLRKTGVDCSVLLIFKK